MGYIIEHTNNALLAVDTIKRKHDKLSMKSDFLTTVSFEWEKLLCDPFISHMQT